MTPAVALATCAEHPRLDAEGRLLLDALRENRIEAQPEVWNAQPAGGWERYDLVVVRSTWDYTFELAQFIDWTRAVGARLLNPPGVVALGQRAHAAIEQRFGRPLYARVDVLRDGDGIPAVLELELIEPSLFLDYVPGSAQALARAILARL